MTEAAPTDEDAVSARERALPLNPPLRFGNGLESLFLVFGTTAIIAGGLVAAVTGPLQWERGSWVAAFLVLVGGVAQVALGAAQHALTPRHPSPATVVTELLAWNLGGAAVIVGTLVRMPLVVDAGGILLVVALVALLRAVRSGAARPRWALLTYRCLLVVLIVSIPIGLVLAHLRA
ncbi:hypothetical protein [Glaciibacter superstes]|uniref:hypothetical protein n=1 Tax=Glaciibacter superstes TaxID=501023 RepID=UPI0003B71E3A|nr:hypothetical protein [Glaciibacter superstes]